MRIGLDEAVERLQRGEVIAIPTETVYGLAAPLANPQAIEQIFRLKQRPQENPLIIHLADATDVETYATNLPPGLRALTDAFWPGSVTFILPIDPATVPAVARASLPTAAFRIPHHALARSLTRRVGALVAPSANLSGRPSATTPEHVEQDFGFDFPVLDGGPCVVGIESTILIYVGDKWMITRLGALSAEAFRAVLGYVPALYVAPKAESVVICPGQHFRHYAPKAQLVLGAGAYPGDPVNVLGFDDRTYSGAHQVISLGNMTDPEIACQRLYSALRSLDEKGLSQVWVDMHFPDTGLWKTLAERLRRAAQK